MRTLLKTESEPQCDIPRLMNMVGVEIIRQQSTASITVGNALTRSSFITKTDPLFYRELCGHDRTYETASNIEMFYQQGLVAIPTNVVSSGYNPSGEYKLGVSDSSIETDTNVLSEDMVRKIANTLAPEQMRKKLEVSIAELDAVWMYVLDIEAPSDVNAISKTIKNVFVALSKVGPEGIDLNGLEPDQVNGKHLAAMLRATGQWRDQVPGWRRAIEVAKKALDRAGINPINALFGLTDK